jgi:hypothetical protein
MNDIYKKIATNLNIDEKLVKKVYIAYWQYIKDCI